MKLKLTTAQKIVITILVMAISVAGFMIRLPGVFRHHDREMHAAYYFIAAAFFTLLFAGKNFWIHLLIIAMLAAFGMAIEYAQEYSNQLVHRRIHGRFDPEDVKYNIMGLIAFSSIWILYLLGALMFRPAEQPSNE